MVLEKSIIKSMNADVAIKTLFSKLNAAMVSPLIAPPVPRRPADRPENDPPKIAFFLFGAITKLFLTRNNDLYPPKYLGKQKRNRHKRIPNLDVEF